MMRYLTRSRFNALDLFVVVYTSLLWKVDNSPGLAVAVCLGGLWLSAAAEYVCWGRKK